MFPFTVFTGTTPEIFILQFLVFDQGIVTDFYDPPAAQLNILDASLAVTLEVSQLNDASPGQGTVLPPDDSSAHSFPFFEWLELSFGDDPTHV
jgi:hypothetical protein